MIGAISGTQSIVVPNMINIQNSSNKLSVPVQPYVARYVQFKHIYGIPSTQEGSGLSVAKLRALDILIERLSGKADQAQSFVKLSNDNVDNLISKLEKEYRIMQSSKGYPSLKPETGIFLNVMA